MSDDNCLLQADDLSKLRRFLYFGVETGVFQTSDVSVKVDNCQCIIRLLSNGKITSIIDEIIKCNEDKQKARTNTTILALALCIYHAPDVNARHLALNSLPKICPTSWQIFYLVETLKHLDERGKCSWGRSFKNAVSLWYNLQSVEQLLVNVINTHQHEKWTHRDLIRLAHVKAQTISKAVIFSYLCNGLEKALQTATLKPKNLCSSLEAVSISSSTVSDTTTTGEAENLKQQDIDKTLARESFTKKVKPMKTEVRFDDDCELPKVIDYLKAVNEIKHTRDEMQAKKLIEKYHFTREVIPTWLQKSKEVWIALTDQMPYATLLQCICKLAIMEILESTKNPSFTLKIKNLISDEIAIKSAKVQPFDILFAMKSYEAGQHRKKDKPKWNVCANIMEALISAFVVSFKNVEATGKRYLIAVDVSGSMNYGRVLGGGDHCLLFTPALAAAAMTMLVARTEQTFEVVTFAKELTPVKIDANMSLDDIKGRLFENPGGVFDCTASIMWALEKKKPVDVFLLFTDCQTWTGQTSASEILCKYRKDMSVPAKLIVCALASKNVSLANPLDKGMLDIAGFDSTTPCVIQNFINNRI